MYLICRIKTSLLSYDIIVTQSTIIIKYKNSIFILFISQLPIFTLWWMTFRPESATET